MFVDFLRKNKEILGVRKSGKDYISIFVCLAISTPVHSLVSVFSLLIELKRNCASFPKSGKLSLAKGI